MWVFSTVSRCRWPNATSWHGSGKDRVPYMPGTRSWSQYWTLEDGRRVCNLALVIFKLIPRIDIPSISYGEGGGGGSLRPETGRGEGSAGWIFTPNAVSAGWIITPTGASIFHKNDPKRVAKFHKYYSTRWDQNEKMIPATGVFLTSIYPARRCICGEKEGSKGRHIPSDSDRRSALHPPTPGMSSVRYTSSVRKRVFVLFVSVYVKFKTWLFGA